MRRTRRALLLLTPALLWPLTGCEHHFFQAHGVISSAGGTLGTWTTTPEGCTRDPADTLATLVWRDVRVAGDKIRDSRLPRLQNTPLRLELRRGASGSSATLETMFPGGKTVLDASSCSTLQVSTDQGKPSITGGRPTLRGQVKLDCQVRGSHVHADIAFSGCEF